MVWMKCLRKRLIEMSELWYYITSGDNNAEEIIIWERWERKNEKYVCKYCIILFLVLQMQDI